MQSPADILFAETGALDRDGLRYACRPGQIFERGDLPEITPLRGGSGKVFTEPIGMRAERRNHLGVSGLPDIYGGPVPVQVP